MAAREKTISVTEFKAKCLELIEAGATHRLERVHLTKRGKPYVTLEVKAKGASPDFESIFGCMKGTTGIPEDFDWETPLYTADELAEQDARFEEKFKNLL